MGLSLVACQNNTAQVAEDGSTETSEKMVNKSPKAVKAALETKGPGYSVGDIATDFNLKGIDGEMYSLKGLEEAKGYIVTFTCNHCPYAVMYEDRLIDLHNKYAPMGYPVVAINPNDPAVQAEDSFEKMQVRAEEKSFPFVYLFDEGQKIYPQYGATRTPHVFLLDEGLKVRYIGAIDDNPRDASAVQKEYLAEAINAVMKGGEPEPDFTKAIGCSIKTKKS
ncbi:MAG: thioredoxin family protein [Saprospiraceae bacterium]|nr:thioredoxin family protein [Saprospiraceae bacterium]